MKVDEAADHVGEDWATNDGARVRIIGVEERRDDPWSGRSKPRRVRVLPLYYDGTEPVDQPVHPIEARTIVMPWTEHEVILRASQERAERRDRAIAGLMVALRGVPDVTATVGVGWDGSGRVFIRMEVESAETLAAWLETLR
jgi:hypothetical protein